jgi:putative membrane protein (TIGR04086 family)
MQAQRNIEYIILFSHIINRKAEYGGIFMPKRKPGRAVRDESSIKSISFKIIRGSIIGIIVFFMLTALLSLFFLKADFPQAVLPAASMAVSAVAALVSGFVAARPTRKNGLTTGVFSAIPLAAAVVIVLLIANKGDLGLYTVLMLLIMAFFASLGGVIAANKKRK